MEGKQSQQVGLLQEFHPRVYGWQFSIPRQSQHTGKMPHSRGEKGDGMFIMQPRNKWEPLQRCIIQQLQLFVFSDTPCKQLSFQSNIIKLSFFSFFLVLYINRANKRENSAVPCNKENSSKLLMLFEKSSFNKVSKNHFLWLSVDSPVCSQ